MKRRTFVRPEAQADVRAAARWYETRETGLGLRFVGEVREALQHITDNPLRFPIVDKDVRRALLHKFPYSIYFVNDPEAAAIIAVLHQHRRPTTWKSRRLDSRPTCEETRSSSQWTNENNPTFQVWVGDEY